MARRRRSLESLSSGITPVRSEPSSRLSRHRARASYALGEIKDPRAVDVLCKALGDEKSEVRVRATMALRNIRDKRAVGPLIEALKDPDWEVVIRTAEALGKIGDTRAVEPLISILMEELKSPRKINIVRDYIREGTDDLPWAGTNMTVALPVIRALGWIGDERATQPLLTALKDNVNGLLILRTKNAGSFYWAKVDMTEYYALTIATTRLKMVQMFI